MKTFPTNFNLFKLIKTKGIDKYVEVVHNTDPKNPMIEKWDSQVDLIIVIDVYHHIEYPRSILKSNVTYKTCY